MTMRCIFLTFIVFALGACQSDIYVRDGVTDGNQFRINPRHLLNEDPVIKSWVGYSLTKSLCQLEIDSDNPARANSYGCELSSRLKLLEEWTLQLGKKPQLRNEYLDTLIAVQDAGYIDEYVVHYYGKKDWEVPAESDQDEFDQWRKAHLKKHQPYTRVIGSWGYAPNTR